VKLIFNLGIILCIISFLFGCDSFSPSSDYEKIADKITEQTARKLKNEKDLVLAGTGGQMMHDIQMMMMGFNFYNEVDIDTARQLLVYSVQEYLTAINSDEKIRPYLQNYPFTAQNVEIVIYFYNPNGSKVSNGKIKIAEVSREEVIYYVDYPEAHTIKAIHEESYEEAVKEIFLNQGSTEKISQTNDRKSSEQAAIIEAVAKDGARVSIKVESLEYSMFELNGGGFKPYESLNIISNSYHESLHNRVKADKNGNILPMGFLPAVIGKSGGICHIDILREEGSIQIKFPWGIESLKDD